MDDSNWRPSEKAGSNGFRNDRDMNERGMKSSGTHAGKGPKGYKRSDERIKEEVSEALSRHGDVDASEIEVEVKEGEVTLTGTVDSRQAKRAAEEAAEDCDGVRDVHNQIRVQSTGSNNQGRGQGQRDSGSNEDQNESGSRSKSRNSVGTR